MESEMQSEMGFPEDASAVESEPKKKKPLTEAQKRAMKKYYEKNREKIIAYSTARNSLPSVLESKRKYYYKNQERMHQYSKERYAEMKKYKDFYIQAHSDDGASI